MTEEQAYEGAKFYVTTQLTRSSMEEECFKRGMKPSKDLRVMEEKLIEAMAQELLQPKQKAKYNSNGG